MTPFFPNLRSLRVFAWFFLVPSLICCTDAQAQGAKSESHGGGRTGTLQKVREQGRIALGYREWSVPFSFLPAGGAPVGYSIDLCRAIVEAVSRKTGREVAIDWVKVTSDSRIAAVVSGQVDLECGSTTHDAERAQQVAFSPVIFVAGTKLMVRRDSSIRTFRDLAHATVSVTAGTTNEKTMQALRERFDLAYAIVPNDDHQSSLDLLLRGQADAFATDDVLLSGLIATRRLQKDYRIIGDYLSYDPYGLMFRKNEPELKRVVETTLYALARQGELERIYDAWFMRRLPTGERIDLPLSPHLEALFRTYGALPE